MKSNARPAMQAQEIPIARKSVVKSAFMLLCFGALAISGCKKEAASDMAADQQTLSSAAAKTDAGNPVNMYTGLSAQTRWELQQVQAATAKYKNLDNAIRDGYADIEVDVEHMGHHYMNTSLVDGTFDMKHPEILVYNRDEAGNPYLVAVEYAVPLTYARPEGFTGSADVWRDDTGFPFWLVHAWVHMYNPDGAFNWTNPLVDLH